MYKPIDKLQQTCQKRLSCICKKQKTQCKEIGLYLTFITLYEQQKYMYDNKVHSVEHCIVSISQPWLRPIVRGKTKAAVEFWCEI